MLLFSGCHLKVRVRSERYQDASMRITYYSGVNINVRAHRGLSDISAKTAWLTCLDLGPLGRSDPFSSALFTATGTCYPQPAVRTVRYV
jgi:hypothetical protein